MSENKGYTTKEKIESFLQKTIEANLSDYILSAQAYIETATGRKFAPDGEESVRYFNGNGRMDLIIADCYEVTKLEISTDSWGDNFSVINSTDYKAIRLEPDLPITKLISRYTGFTKGLQNIKITAKWGWEEIPADISFCATVLASGMYNAQINGSNLKSESIGQYSVSYGEKDWENLEKVKKILQQYENIQI